MDQEKDPNNNNQDKESSSLHSTPKNLADQEPERRDEGMGGGDNHSKNQDSGFLNNKENAIHPQESIEDSQQEAEQNDYDENADQDEGKNIQKDENSPDKVDNEDQQEQNQDEEYMQDQQAEHDQQDGGDINASDMNEAYIGEFSSDYINSELFKLFDVDGSGKITRDDLTGCAKSMGWKPEQLDELLMELDPNHDGEITEEEFLLIMKYIQQRQSTFPPINQQSQSQMSSSIQMYDMDKKKYGALLPKTGVYFLPDEKVIGFLKIMNQLRHAYDRQGNYNKAKLLKMKFEELSKAEQQRQEQNMRIAQEKELFNIENAQRLQFQEFSEAWDKYMSDYEATAFELVEQLKMKQDQELLQMQETMTNSFIAKYKWSKDLIEMKKQEKIYFSIKDYDNAERTRLKIQIQEQIENEQMQDKLAIYLEREENHLRQKQQLSLKTLLKRIQRDREEQVSHRQLDSKRLIQRNKNLLKDILEKQATEQRRTQQFLKFALGKREEKSEKEIIQEMNQRAYNPKTDSLMPRTKDHTRSAMASQQHQTSEFSVYDNNNSKFRNTGNNNMSFVKHPLRTSKVNRSSNGRDRTNGMNNSLQKRVTGAEDPKDLVKELKQMKEQRLQTKKNQTPAPNQRFNDSNKKTVTLPQI